MDQATVCPWNSRKAVDVFSWIWDVLAQLPNVMKDINVTAELQYI